MPTVDIHPDELRTLASSEEVDDDTLIDDLFALGLELEGTTEAGAFELEFAPDRLDRLSVEGVARSLRYHYGIDRGVYVPSTNQAEWTIDVEGVPGQRPYVTGAVIRGVELTESSLESLIQLQEKLHATIGRDRAKGAIGIHDLTMLKGSAATEGNQSVTYTGIDPDGDRFVPLESDREMTPAEVLSEHHIGAEYADLVDEYDSMPAIYDDLGLFSFPPVINGRRTEVTVDTTDLFVEMTGTDQWTIDKMLAIVCYALDARGAKIEAVTVRYEDYELVRPDLSTKTKSVSHDRIESILGIDLDEETVIDLAERAGLDATIDGEADQEYTVAIPPYRVDVLHPMDVIDDIGRAYGFNELEASYPDIGTIGSRHGRSRLENALRTQLVGLGFEDLLNFHMINDVENFDRMRIGPDLDVFGSDSPVRITEPYSDEYTMLRTWVLPSLLMVLERNTHRRYPQDLAEIGFVAHVDPAENTGIREGRHVAGVVAHHDASYEAAKERLQSVFRRFGHALETPAIDHPSFIDGRTAAVRIDGETAGVIGEIHPAVLVDHDLEVPVAAFEFDTDPFDADARIDRS